MDTTKKALIFLRQSGATVDDSYQISVTDYEKAFNKTQVGNTFIVDTNHGDAELDTASIGLSWLSEDTLQIKYNKKLRTFVQLTKTDDVVIIYKSK